MMLNKMENDIDGKYYISFVILVVCLIVVFVFVFGGNLFVLVVIIIN